MKKVVRITSLICLLSIICLLTVGAYKPAPAADKDNAFDVSQTAADQFVLDEIRRSAAEGKPFCTWTGKTKFETPIVLYDVYDQCNGYVYKLRTEGKETGYVQLNCFNGNFDVFCSSFTGIPAYEGLCPTFEESLRSSCNGKLYFLGNMTYCIKTDDNTFQALGSVNTINVNDAKAEYDSFLNAVRKQTEEQAKIDITANGETKNTFQAEDFTLVSMNDFSDFYATRPNGTRQKVTQHCSPTAATNIMRYFRSTGASPLSKSLNDGMIFMEMYYAMDTNSIRTSDSILAIGTNAANILPGITSFCSTYSCPPASIGVAAVFDTEFSIALSELAYHIDQGDLLQIELEDFTDSDIGHSVVAFDYSGSDLIISTGWDTSYHKYSYFGLKIGQYEYIGY